MHSADVSVTHSLILLSEGYLALQDKTVIVIGGGDTGTDCIGTSVRHGAKQVIVRRCCILAS